MSRTVLQVTLRNKFNHLSPLGVRHLTPGKKTLYYINKECFATPMPDPALTTQNHQPQKKTAILKWVGKLKQPKVFIPLSIFLIIYIALNIWVYFSGTIGSWGRLDKAPPAPTAPPTPTHRPPITPKPLPSGRQEYTLSHSSTVKGPKPLKVIVDPLTPDSNQTQTFTVTIKNDSPVTSAKVNVITDNKKVTYALTLISGTAQDGTWQGSWKLQDTYIYDYFLQFDFQSTTGNYIEGLRFRQTPKL
ncbi:hypothetical protein KKB64_04230 [Patescibacteria group bacterium]|nr:hypothetical protein [Patescibacteria group bacterium]MBU1472963.1 hypothetical protein [Patescibacteria group bacterium]MBU2459689.1 hypothetical protein [Patescibacteria group bacterium]MBU2544570.1 hypothetical protein [Patescibacteria group bacterium]